MSSVFSRLGDNDLAELIAALQAGRLGPPYSALQVSRIAQSTGLSEGIREGLNQLASQGFSRAQIATLLTHIAHDRRSADRAELSIDLVTSGPEAPGVANRETAVVVRELFARAETSVLVVGYAVHQGQRVFRSLAERMHAVPDLEVQLFLNIARPDGDKTPAEILVARFKQRFKDCQWPAGFRLPEVYYDPRSLADDQSVRSSLHAKCVVVDAQHVFVSSANFTEAAQERNIEVGLSIRNRWLAEQLIRHFKLLYDQRLAERAF